jgi:electron transport complex protein RnfG
MIKDILRLGLILFVIAAIATGILAYVNSVTLPKIELRKAKEAEETRQKLMPDAKSFTEVKAKADTSFVYYIANNDKDEVLGYSFVAMKRGYSSNIKTMVALDKNYEIISIQVIDQNETPGLGTWCADPSFPEKFKGKKPYELVVDKDGGPIKSITGATITTRAITSSLHEAIVKVKTDLENAKEGGK